MIIYPLFSKVICTEDIPDIFFKEYELLKTKYEFQKINFELENCSETSKDLHVLENFPKLKKTLLNYFLEFKRNVFRYENTTFDITTSWVTKTEKGSQSEYHTHRNSYYSGILYISDTTLDFGKLEFLDSNCNQILPSPPTDFNIYNSSGWSIQPKKNLLVFFPSNLQHRIGTHNSETPRYSVAFNLFPINKFGMRDSQLNIKNLK